MSMQQAHCAARTVIPWRREEDEPAARGALEAEGLAPPTCPYRAADGTVESKLARKVSAAQQAVTAAEHALATSHKQSSKRISKALNALAAYLRGLKTHDAKRALQKDVRAALAAPVAALRADLKTLRGK